MKSPTGRLRFHVAAYDEKGRRIFFGFNIDQQKTEKETVLKAAHEFHYRLRDLKLNNKDRLGD